MVSEWVLATKIRHIRCCYFYCSQWYLPKMGQTRPLVVLFEYDISPHLESHKLEVPTLVVENVTTSNF